MSPASPLRRKIRCAVYTRKSHEEGLELEFNSLHAQREACEAYIASQRQEGWLLVPDRYDDGGISGGTLERPALKRLLHDIECGVVDVVVVYKVDRLSRSLTDFAKLVDVFDRHDVSFVSITQQFNTTTSMGRLTLNILLSFAQFEREVIGERIRDKFAASRKKGMWMGGPPPLGYDVVSRKLVVNQAEAKLVRLIFRRFVTLGSATMLAKELSAEGHHTQELDHPVGPAARRPAVRQGRPLQDPATTGSISARRCTRAPATPASMTGSSTRRLWDRVHEILAKNGHTRGNVTRASTPAPLRGLIRCAHCGKAMTPSHTRRRGRLYRYYVCTGSIKRGADTCPVRSVAAGDIERLVLEQVRRLLRSPEIVSRTVAAYHGLAQDQDRRPSGSGRCWTPSGAWTRSGRSCSPPSRPASSSSWSRGSRSTLTASRFTSAPPGCAAWPKS